MGIVIPVVLTAAGGLAWWKVKKQKYGKMTPERKKVFEEALRTMKEPAKLRQLANVYDKYGLKAEAKELRKRAALREAPANIKKQRAEAFQKGLNSTDPQKVSKLADAFHKIGAYGAEKKLRDYSSGLVSGDAPIGPGGIHQTPLEQVVLDKQTVTK